MFTGPSQAGKETCARRARSVTTAAFAFGFVLAACGKERPFAEDAPTSPDMTAPAGTPGSAPASAGGTVETCSTPPCTSTPERVEPVGGIMGASDGTNDLSGANAEDAECTDGATESCGPPAEEGICRFGTRTCAAGAWGECTGAVLPAARDCASTEDNDCDGQPDNTIDDTCRCAAAATQPCDEHPGLDGRGPCRAGVQTCVLAPDNTTSTFGECTGAVAPQLADSCEIQSDDADCDGIPNGGCTCVEGTTIACGPDTDLGTCVRGTSTCTNGAFTECVGAVFPTRRDCTSGEDNDCDGLPDNTIDATCACAVGETRACGAHPGRDGNGPCQAGQQTCQAGAQNATSAFGACVGSVGPALRDSCTVLDDDSDCDSLPNDGCECIAGQGNGPCSDDPSNARCNAQGQCAPCQGNVDCSLVSGGRNLCVAGVCTAPRCGDGTVQPERGETCDDGNTVSGDGCSRTCVAGQAPRGGTSFASTHMCAVLPSGAVGCWGLNTSGQLGVGSASTSTTLEPPRVGGRITNATDIALMGNSTCAALGDGTVSCWGAGFGGSPVPVAGVTGVTQLAAGDDLFCGRQTGDSVICWGTDGLAETVSGLSGIVQVARGDRHNCARRDDGALFCAGGNSEGEGGFGVIGTGFAETPAQATVFGDLVDVATGYRSTCVRVSGSGSVQCVGNGTTAGSPTALPNGNTQPVTVLNLGNAVKLAAGEQHMCALTDDDLVKCWGTGLAVGSGDEAGSLTPVTVVLPDAAIDVGAGSFTSCARLADSSVYCWGNLAVTAASATPAEVNLR